MKYYKKIIGERLYLSPINTDEADSYIKWMNDEAVAVNFGQYPRLVASKNDMKWLYEPASDMHRYAIVLLDEDVLIGSISLHNIDHLNRNAFIGIFIGENEHRNKGYGAEAIRLILNYGFKTMNLHNIMLTVHADNLAGITCYKKVGFRETGRLREWIFKDGMYVDKIYMGILEREFDV
ncbi:MAG: GNAT family protein [Oscillospiraceae bacterium]|nr:GNAT family protein [Oscillospiraceae bacterium]